MHLLPAIARLFETPLIHVRRGLATTDRASAHFASIAIFFALNPETFPVIRLIHSSRLKAPPYEASDCRTVFKMYMKSREVLT